MAERASAGMVALQLAWAHAWIVCVSAALKLLLAPGYHSTDFEVHRNWMAITYNLPVTQWYFDSTSQWTLDYPPLFAYFQWLLARAAATCAPAAVQLSAAPINDARVLLFQRASVVLVDVCLYAAVCVFLAAVSTRHRWSADVLAQRAPAALLLMCTHAGLLLVDHLHFQYNGLIIALLVLVLSFAYLQQPLSLAVAFTALVLTKHLFLVLGPAIAVFLLAPLIKSAVSGRIAHAAVAAGQLAACVLGFIAAVMLPLTWNDPAAQLRQLAVRLFPFERGLVHAYWAPNVWSAYMGLDRLVRAVLRRSRMEELCALPLVSSSGTNNATCLPKVPPIVAHVAVLSAVLPLVVLLARQPSAQRLHWAVVTSYAAAFMFGWHGHEKAVLYMLLPLQLLAIVCDQYRTHARAMLVWSLVALLPLIFTPVEQPVVLAMHVAYVGLAGAAPGEVGGGSLRTRDDALAGLVACAYVAASLFLRQLEYLPLMLVSIACAAGLLRVAWLLRTPPV